MEAEATYDTPWEFSAAAKHLPSNRNWSDRPKLVTARRDGASAVLNASGFVQSVVKGKGTQPRAPVLSPLPGLRARAAHRRRPGHARPDSTPAPTKPGPLSVWEPRGPDADSRDPSEYEEPWDRQRAAQLRDSLALSVSVAASTTTRPTSAHTYEGLWETVSGTPPVSTASASPRDRDRDRDTSSASPASSSTASSSSGRSKASVPDADAAPPGLVRPWPPSDFTGDGGSSPSQSHFHSPLTASPRLP